MSRTKAVAYGDHFFWAYDVALGIFLKYLIDVIEKTPQASMMWSHELSSWCVVACVQDIGLTLSTDWPTVQKQQFVALVEEACAQLATRGSISAEEIAHWRLEDGHLFTRGANEVLTVPIVELGHAIIALISRKLPEPPQHEVWFYGTPTGRSTIRMDI